MADAQSIPHSAKTAVRPPGAQDPQLRHGWGSSGATDRPARVTQHMQTDDTNPDVGALVGALGAVALVLIAAAVIVILFAF